ncbi:MAG: CopY/TcrY family copper transport repressor [Enterococcus sp.]
MNNQELVKISDSEWEIMRVVWTLGHANAQQITDILATSKEWKAATVKTLLGRLVKKGALWTEQDGKKYIYHPNVSESETVKSATETLFAHICAKQIGNTIAELLEEAELTPADVAHLQEVLANKTTVPTIACNCIPGQCECAKHQVMNESTTK